MPYKFYARLDKNNVCVSIIKVPINMEYDNILNCIPIQDEDDSILNKRYNDGIWEDVDPMYFYRPLSEQETATLQMQSDLEYLVCLKELGL